MELEEKTKERERTEQSERGRKEEEETSLEEVHLKKKLKQTALEGTTEWELKNQFSLNSIGLSQATFHLFWNSKFTFPLSLIKFKTFSFLKRKITENYFY